MNTMSGIEVIELDPEVIEMVPVMAYTSYLPICTLCGRPGHTPSECPFRASLGLLKVLP